MPIVGEIIVETERVRKLYSLCRVEKSKHTISNSASAAWNGGCRMHARQPIRQL
jgi:hypothetical protein